MNVRTASTVARTEVKRTLRSVTAEKTKVLVLGLVGLFLLGSVTVAGGYLLPTLGEEVAAGVTGEQVSAATEIATGGAAVAWIFLVFMIAIRAFTAAADPDKPAFLLISTSLRNVVTGIIAAEAVLLALWLVPPALLLSGAFAYGAGTILPILIALVAVSLMIVTAVPVGFVVGTWIRHLVTVYEPIARYRWVLFVGFWLAYFGGIATGHFDQLMAQLFSTLQDSPLGWFGHVVLAGVPNVPASELAIVGAATGAAVLATAATAVGVASARIHWFADPARFDDEPSRASEEGTSGRLESLLPSGLGRPVRTIATTAIRRTKRAPIRLAYIGYPLLGMIGFAQVIIQTGTVPSYVAVLLCLWLVWAAGALFTLNPLGDLGRALPAVVSSPLSGRQAVTGLVLAGTLVAAPVALVASAILGAVSPLSAEQTLALIAGTAAGTVVTPALATGIGSAFPRFGSVNVTNNREAVMPSKTAFAAYSLAVLLPAAAAVVLYTDAAAPMAELAVAVSAWTPGPEVAPSARGITVAAWTVLAAGLVAPIVSCLYAIERFDWYALE
ncbi:hypothetical protein OB905_10130 [Halobacteria archaeon AArc-dxtr1]|nr:hypothetical protein [Halobacteria archaeon AArc-dxtr1]